MVTNILIRPLRLSRRPDVVTRSCGPGGATTRNGTDPSGVPTSRMSCCAIRLGHPYQRASCCGGGRTSYRAGRAILGDRGHMPGRTLHRA